MTIKPVKLQFKESRYRKEYWSDVAGHELHCKQDDIVDVHPAVAKKLMENFPDNFFLYGYPTPEKILSQGQTYSSKYSLGFFIDAFQKKVSGGRYHSWLFANILADNFNTTVVTNGDPTFYQEMINNPKLKIATDKSFGLHWHKNEFNFILAAPKWSGIYAHKYAKRWDLPCYLMLLEPPNFTRLYRSGPDSTEEYWAEYKLCLQDCKRVILSTHLTAKYARKWLGIDPKKVTVIYPPLNQSALPKYPPKEEHAIVWISRMIDNKRPYDPIEVVRMVDPTLTINYITTAKDRIIRRAEERGGIKVKFFHPDDKEKFEIISRSKLMIFSSIFEGHGMPPGEALLCKKPCIVYDLPILREIYKDRLEYAKMKDVGHMARIAKKLLDNEPYRKRRGEEGYRFIKYQSSFQRARKELKNLLLNHRITFSIIAFEGEDYIEKCLKAVYVEAYQIIIAEGAVKLMADSKGYYQSRDKTIELIKNFPDPEKRIKLIQVDRPWRDKAEMKQAILIQSDGDIYFQVDVDEFYHQEDIHKIKDAFNDPTVDMVTFGAYHFWKDLSHIIIGGKWDGRNPRVWRIKGNMEYKDHHYPHRDGTVYTEKHFKAVNLGKLRYHYGYVRPEKVIEDKIKFMSQRDKNKAGQYASEFNNWLSGGGNVMEFKGKHPEVILGG